MAVKASVTTARISRMAGVFLPNMSARPFTLPMKPFTGPVRLPKSERDASLTLPMMTGQVSIISPSGPAPFF